MDGLGSERCCRGRVACLAEGDAGSFPQSFGITGPQRVGLPHVRPLGDKLWEMRLRGRDGIGRAIYTAAGGRRWVVLHAFVKKTQKTPRSAINLALKRSKELGS